MYEVLTHDVGIKVPRDSFIQSLVAAKVRMCAIRYSARQADLGEFGEQGGSDLWRRIRAYTSLNT
jgi:hypothetical protein